MHHYCLPQTSALEEVHVVSCNLNSADEIINCNLLHCRRASSMHNVTIWRALSQACSTDDLYFMTCDMLLQA